MCSCCSRQFTCRWRWRASIKEKSLRFPRGGAPSARWVLPPLQCEGASTVSFNHQLAARFTGAGVTPMTTNTLRVMKYIFASLAALLIASPAFAQGAAASPAAQWVPLGAGLGMALAAGLCGIGHG